MFWISGPRARASTWRGGVAGLMLCLAWLAWLSAPPALAAETFVVSPEGSPLSLQAALAQAQDGAP